MKYSVWIREDADGNDITNPSRGRNTLYTVEHTMGGNESSLDQWAKNAVDILNAAPQAAILFQNGAILEVADKSNSIIGLQIIGVNEKPEIVTMKKKEGRYYKSFGFIRNGICTFQVRLIRTGVPG